MTTGTWEGGRQAHVNRTFSVGLGHWHAWSEVWEAETFEEDLTCFMPHLSLHDLGCLLGSGPEVGTSLVGSLGE